MNTPSFQDLEILIFIPVLETTGYTTFPLRGSFHVCCDEPLFFKAGESQLECINLSEQVCISLSERYRSDCLSLYFIRLAISCSLKTYFNEPMIPPFCYINHFKMIVSKGEDSVYSKVVTSRNRCEIPLYANYVPK